MLKGKCKDDINSGKDLATYCKSRRLHVQVTDGGDGDRRGAMPSTYVLRKEQIKISCDWICELKFLDGYAFNLSAVLIVQMCGCTLEKP